MKQEKWFGYQGGTFNEREWRQGLEKGFPLTLDIAIPGKCLNNCVYCGYYAVNSTGKLKQREIIKIFQDFKALGGKSIKILGEGEPLLRKDIFELLEEIKQLGMIPVLFTCGDVIGNDDLARKIHGISGKKIVFKLSNIECTVMLKFEDFGNKQDAIVRSRGYYKMRDMALQRLIDAGFNQFQPTRLGFGIVLLRQNMESVKRIYQFCMENRIYPLICPIMPIGKMKNKNERKKLAPDKSEVRFLHKYLCETRKKFGIKATDVSDFPGGLPCDISRAGFYIGDSGNVYLCEADDLVGNVRESELRDLWVNIDKRKWEKYGNRRMLGLCLPKRKNGIL